MAIITHVIKNNSDEFTTVKHEFNGYAWQWICENINRGENFSVFDGAICEENEISRDDAKMEFATDVTIVMLPSGALLIPFIIAAVVAVATVLLMPEIDIDTANQQAGSANNELSNRRNKTRINERIVDLVGEQLCVFDVMQPEYSFFDDGQNEVRIGAYCVARNTVDVAELKDGENLIADISGAAAGIYRPFTSPNNSAPFEQIGEPINAPIVGVYQSINAVGQTLEAPEVLTVELDAATTISVNKGLKTARILSPSFDKADYAVGTYIELVNVYLDMEDGNFVRVGNGSKLLVTNNQLASGMVIDVSSDDSFQAVLESFVPYNVGPAYKPKMESPDVYDGDTYKITDEKVNRLLFNVYAPSGMYKRSSGDKQEVSVDFELAYYLLDDNYERVGSLKRVAKTITGTTDNSIGETIDVTLAAPSYIEWYIYRTSYEDVDFNGSVVDVIKLKSVFGLFDIEEEHFGNITMVQTKRKQVEQVTAVANPEVNAICTEMIYKYLGNGVFDTVLTKNTQAMQSLIAKALDPKIGRLTVDDLDLDLLLQTQLDNETYYQTDSAGKCSYSFDSLETSAQEVFYLIANAASVILWREGRVLKSWFEKPQSVPEMIFTHRSKIIGEETWNRQLKIEKDGIEFPYISELTNSQETFTYPEHSVNPKKIDYKGFRGEEQAIWRALREYYKLMNQRITVDFTATAEGRFAKPSKLIGVVKGTRVGQTGGYVMNVELLTVELSQEVEFTPGDDHFLVLKTRNGGTQTVSVTETENPRIVLMDFAPMEEIYFGNDELKTEFSFGNEARLQSQLMLVQTVDASDRNSTAITAVNYSDKYYLGDPVSPIDRAYSDAYSNGYA